MRKFVICLIALGCVLGLRSEATAQADVRVGGGLIFDGTVWGGGVAVDIAVTDMIKVSPFGEYYKKSGVSTTPVGANIKLGGPLGESMLSFYVGAGGGLIRRSGGGASLNKLMIDAVGGIDFPVNEKVSIYAEGKYMWGADDVINDVGAFAGVKFGLGE